MLRVSIVGPVLILMIVVLGACGRGSGGALSDEAPLPDATLTAAAPAPTALPIPTFTPTPQPPAPEAENEDESASAAQAEDGVSPSEAGDVADSSEGEADEENGELEGEDAAELDLSVLLAPTPTPQPAPVALVTAAGINVRAGPGTAYAQVGAAVQGDLLTVVGRNVEGDWWQVCCFNEQPGWVYGPLVEARHADQIAVAAEIPPLPEAETIAPVALATQPQPALADADETTPADAPSVEPEPVAEQPPAEEPAAESPAPQPPAEPAPAAAPPGQPAPTQGTAGNFDPNAQYQIVHYRTLGYDDNNGGIFNEGGQHLIFLTVLDEAGNGIDGVVVKNANADNLTLVTGDKGPGRTEVRMYWEPFKLYVAQDGSGPVTSHVSNQMNMAFPHIPDIVGLMGPADLEYAICPSVDDRCDPPFHHAHWSYEITFQKVR